MFLTKIQNVFCIPKTSQTLIFADNPQMSAVYKKCTKFVYILR